MLTTHAPAPHRGAGSTATLTGLALILTAAFTLLAGCAGAPNAEDRGRTRTSLPAAAETTWTLVRIEDGSGIVDDPVPAPSLDLRTAGAVSGNDGCASIDGRAVVPPHVAHDGVQEDPTAPVRFLDLVSPAIGCVATNGIERRYSAALEAVRRLSLKNGGLELTGDGVVLRYEHSASPTPTPTPTPTATDLPAAALPTEAARLWTLAADGTLGIDLRTPDRILVRAGCLGFTGRLTTTTAPDDPASGAPAGPTVAIRVVELPDESGTVRCMGFTADQREFVDAVQGATLLTVVGDRLYLSGDDGRAEFVPAA